MVIRWQRERFRRFWVRLSKSDRRRRGRPTTAAEICRLIDRHRGGGQPTDLCHNTDMRVRITAVREVTLSLVDEAMCGFQQGIAGRSFGSIPAAAYPPNAR